MGPSAFHQHPHHLLLSSSIEVWCWPSEYSAWNSRTHSHWFLAQDVAYLTQSFACAKFETVSKLKCRFSSYVQANSEVSALLGRIPSAVGYQPTLATDLGMLQERITTTDKGSITSVQVKCQINDALMDLCCSHTSGIKHYPLEIGSSNQGGGDLFISMCWAGCAREGWWVDNSCPAFYIVNWYIS